MKFSEIKSIIESLLFAWSDPLPIKEISKLLEIDVKTIENIIKEMSDDFNFNMRGIQIIRMNDYVQLATRAENFEYVQKLMEPKQNKGLTQATLETLAIIAYKQPIPKAEVESIRGVKCDRAISTLIEKDLVEEKGRLDKPGRPIIYGTTLNFLKSFGLSNVADLPPISQFQMLAEEDEEDIRDIFKL
ncbi:SMC-Scp complex subunit ScpB [Alkaliphilus serpentinus]|uniref:Segregation and condensation protein B n=1 Tax=Alkaliphilus serpentinus TaxID=1482731 RepID=A0A833M8U8_9FIRM|nr:SMC-Scp complex subunit ScpB [Alkaliphilus serpentinus]KAB3527366.1 SMC-Scp complex subunit ScpB [Alkaliphilus serpentinus]